MNEQMQNFEDFWALVVDVWHQGFLGIELGRILGALGIFIVFLIFRKLFTRFALSRLKVYAEKTHSRIDDALINAMSDPIRFIPVVMGFFFASEYLQLNEEFQAIADNITRSLIVFTLFWCFFAAVEPLSFLFSKLEKIFSRPMVDWLVKTIKAAFIFLGAATILELWGIKVGPILAGLGLFGVAVALGAQDLFKNLIAGVLILAEKRFAPGDWIKVDGVVEGTVENIGFRSTVIRRFDMAPVYVPNSKLSDDAVTNFSSMTYRRIYWTIGVVYGTSVPQLRQIRDGIDKYVSENQAFVPADQASTFVRIDAFNDSSIDIMLYCFTRTTNWGEWLEIKETLAYEIKNIVEGAGSSFAFPSRSLYLESVPGDAPEAFQPPGQEDATQQ
ncbi:MAG: mechanosensitive ion channel family protein [Pseudomonadota bacterium]